MDFLPIENLTNEYDYIGMFHLNQMLIDDDQWHDLNSPRIQQNAFKKNWIRVLFKLIDHTSNVYFDMPREILCLSQNPSGFTIYTCSILYGNCS